MHTRALVLFSGGQDSTTCLAHALTHYAHVETLGFDYGQRHSVELQARQTVLQRLRWQFPHWAARLGPDHVLNVDVIGQIGGSSLTEDVAIAMQQDGLPNTFVPGRNLLFMTLAGALAYRRGLQVLVTGVSEADFSGYPDCRDDSIKAMQVALNTGMGANYALHTPLMWRSKKDAWMLARSLGGDALVNLIVEESHTCYMGQRGQREPWGYGCGTCPACRLRAAGYAAYAEAQAACAQTPLEEEA